MIKGIGNDLIEIGRVKKACEKEAFLLRYFTGQEIAFANGKASTLAGDFAVKEAVAKCLGTGFRGFMPIDIEVFRDELGKPYVHLHRGARVLAEKLHIDRIHVTISNTAEYATAVAIGEEVDSYEQNFNRN